MFVNSLEVIAMETRCCLTLILLVLQIVFSGQWITSAEEKSNVARKFRKSASNHSKHQAGNQDTKRRVTVPNTRELRKKPSGHLTALKADDMDNEGVVSVAVGPPPTRPKYNKTKHQNKNITINTRGNNNNAIDFVKDVLSQLGREFLSHQVNEDFVFGQYIGNSMKNLTSEIKLKMQHEILDLIVKYQNINNNNDNQKAEDKNQSAGLKEVKMEKKIISISNNDTDEIWPDFTNLAKIVG